MPIVANVRVCGVEPPGSLADVIAVVGNVRTRHADAGQVVHRSAPVEPFRETHNPVPTLVRLPFQAIHAVKST